MINVVSLIQLRAFARQDGALLSVLWIVGFASMMFTPVPFINDLAILATPFFVGWRLSKFRNYALNDVISYRRAFVYCLYTFFYGSLLFAVAQGLYFQFLDHGRFIELIEQAASLNSALYQSMGMDVNELKEAINLLKVSNGIEKAFSFMMVDIAIGILLSLFIAVFGAKKVPTMKLPEHDNGQSVDKENR